MSPRILIAAVSTAVLISSASFAQQTPETSAAAMASPQAKSESLTNPGEASKMSSPASSRSFTADRAATDGGSGKTKVQPAAKN